MPRSTRRRTAGHSRLWETLPTSGCRTMPGRGEVGTTRPETINTQIFCSFTECEQAFYFQTKEQVGTPTTYEQPPCRCCSYHQRQRLPGRTGRRRVRYSRPIRREDRNHLRRQ